jgi:hypothetical protein
MHTHRYIYIYYIIPARALAWPPAASSRLCQQKINSLGAPLGAPLGAHLGAYARHALKVALKKSLFSFLFCVKKKIG